MINIIESVSKLSNVPEKTLQKLAQLTSYSICDELVTNKSDIVDIDLGIGILKLCIDDNLIKYKFIPGQKFEEDLKQAVKTGKSPVETILEAGAVKKMLELYRDLL